MAVWVQGSWSDAINTIHRREDIKLNLSQYLIENAFSSGVALKQPSKIPTIYNSRYGHDLNTNDQIDIKDDEDDSKQLNQFNDNSDSDQDDSDDSSREKAIDDALKRLRAAILGNDVDSNKNSSSRYTGGNNDLNGFDDYDQDDGDDEDEEMPQDPNMHNMDDDSQDYSDDKMQNDEQPVKRVVKGAHLVYKRKMPDGLYEELWMYNIGKQSKMKEYDIRREILRGTDIEERDTDSSDGTQSYKIWTAGNGQLLHITGLPN